MPDWFEDIQRVVQDEFVLRYDMVARWVENWTINDKIFWASMATLLVVGAVVILNLTKGSRLGALRQVLTSFALCFLVAYGFGLSSGISSGGLSFIFGR